MRAIGRRQVGIAVLALFLASTGGAEETPSAGEILDCGFSKRFDRNLIQNVELIVRRDDHVIRRFRIQLASKEINGRVRSLAFFLAPSDTKDTRVLTIENEDRRDEHFLYMPVLGRTRRIYGGRRAESFLGSDFSFEDWERLRADEVTTTMLPQETLEEETVYIVEAVPKFESGYSKSIYKIAKSDCSILEIVHFKHGRSTPSKIVSVPRSEMTLIDGEYFPTRAVAQNLEQGQQTEVLFSDMHRNAELSDGLFSVSSLLHAKTIPGLSRSRP